jgi:hypothetical protein
MQRKKTRAFGAVTMRRWPEILATFCCAVFFGAALYISLVQHPAALETGNDFGARFFPVMYRRAAVLQASLALIGCAAGIGAWLKGAGRWWLAAGLLLDGVVPFTLIVIKPVNDALLRRGDVSALELGGLRVRWGDLHWARGLTFVVCLAAIAHRPEKGDFA